ncbi:MAG: CvpA family protein [Acidimicrobiales bacterium]
MPTLDWLDLVIIAIVVLAALHGYRRGAISQLFSYAGLGLGLIVGIAVAPFAVGLVTSLVAKAVVALVVVLGAGALLSAIGRRLGFVASRLTRRVHLGPLDSVAGAVVAGVYSARSLCAGGHPPRRRPVADAQLRDRQVQCDRARGSQPARPQPGHSARATGRRRPARPLGHRGHRWSRTRCPIRAGLAACSTPILTTRKTHRCARVLSETDVGRVVRAETGRRTDAGDCFW